MQYQERVVQEGNTTVLPISGSESNKLYFVIASASVGTLIEFYDLILAIVLAPVIAHNLFPEGQAHFLETLAIIMISYLIRPIGALIFGKIGDSKGRKKPFLVSLLMMGVATFLIGCIPTFQSIGWFAPLSLLMLRILQGLAISGEYTGAAIFVAEHAPAHKRGFYTGFIQASIPLSLLMCLGILFITQRMMDHVAFLSYGWRFPFLFSAVLVALGYLVRKKIEETPLYAQTQAKGSISNMPVKETFRAKGNIKSMLLIIFGGCAAQSTLMQTTHFVMLFFLQRVVLLSMETTVLIIGIATLLSCPFFQFFGALSDKVGRKNIILSGLIFSAVLVPFAFYFILQEGNPGTMNTIHEVSGRVVTKITVLTFCLHICCAMVYGPMGAFILESFPTHIRFTSMGFVYNIGNGVLGGSTTFIAELLRSIIFIGAAYSFFVGLIYPLLLILMAIVINAFFVPETNRRNL
jgi:MFS family permease